MGVGRWRRNERNDMSQTRNLLPGFILLVAVATLSSVYSAQYMGGLRPCVLCLYERIPWFAAAALMLVGILMPASASGWRGLLLLCGLAMLASTALAGYHVGVEQKWWAGPGACSAPEQLPQNLDELKNLLLPTAEKPPRCDEIPWSLWGISMAGYNGILSVGLALLALGSAASRR